MEATWEYKLITAVFGFPVLYDTKCRSHRKMSKDAWRQVAGLVGVHEFECRRDWNNLHEKHRRERELEREGRDYRPGPYSAILSFLNPFIEASAGTRRLLTNDCASDTTHSSTHFSVNMTETASCSPISDTVRSGEDDHYGTNMEARWKYKLITAVSGFPVLYDTNFRTVTHLNTRNDAWRQVAELLGVPESECKREWKLLRHRQSIARYRERKQRESGKGSLDYRPWRYSAIMSFLNPFIDVLSESRRPGTNGCALDTTPTSTHFNMNMNKMANCSTTSDTERSDEDNHYDTNMDDTWEYELITAVFGFPVLYEPNFSSLANLDTHIDAWRQVAELVGVPEFNCRKTWQTLRYYHCAERKRERKGRNYRPWKYSTILSFLNPFIKGTGTVGCASDTTQTCCDEEDQYDIEDESSYGEHSGESHGADSFTGPQPPEAEPRGRKGPAGGTPKRFNQRDPWFADAGSLFASRAKLAVALVIIKTAPAGMSGRQHAESLSRQLMEGDERWKKRAQDLQQEVTKLKQETLKLRQETLLSKAAGSNNTTEDNAGLGSSEEFSSMDLFSSGDIEMDSETPNLLLDLLQESPECTTCINTAVNNNTDITMTASAIATTIHQPQPPILEGHSNSTMATIHQPQPPILEGHSNSTMATIHQPQPPILEDHSNSTMATIHQPQPPILEGHSNSTMATIHQPQPPILEGHSNSTMATIHQPQPPLLEGHSKGVPAERASLLPHVQFLQTLCSLHRVEADNQRGLEALWFSSDAMPEGECGSVLVESVCQLLDALVAVCKKNLSSAEPHDVMLQRAVCKMDLSTSSEEEPDDLILKACQVVARALDLFCTQRSPTPEFRKRVEDSLKELTAMLLHQNHMDTLCGAERLTVYLITLGSSSMSKSFLIRHILTEISLLTDQLWGAYKNEGESPLASFPLEEYQNSCHLFFVLEDLLQKCRWEAEPNDQTGFLDHLQRRVFMMSQEFPLFCMCMWRIGGLLTSSNEI